MSPQAKELLWATVPMAFAAAVGGLILHLESSTVSVGWGWGLLVSGSICCGLTAFALAMDALLRRRP